MFLLIALPRLPIYTPPPIYTLSLPLHPLLPTVKPLLPQEEENEELLPTHPEKRKHLPSYVEEVNDDTTSQPQFSFCDVAPLVMNGISTIRDDQV